MFKILKRLIFIILLNMSCVVNNKNYNQGRQILEKEEENLIEGAVKEAVEKAEEMLKNKYGIPCLLGSLIGINTGYGFSNILNEAKDQIKEHLEELEEKEKNAIKQGLVINNELEKIEKNLIKQGLVILLEEIKGQNLKISTTSLEKTILKILSKELESKQEQPQPQTVEEPKLTSSYVVQLKELLKAYSRILISLRKELKILDKQPKIAEGSIIYTIAETIAYSIEETFVPKMKELSEELLGKGKEYLKLLKQEVEKILENNNLTK